MPLALAQSPMTASVRVVVPVNDAKGAVIESEAPGAKTYPVFRLADDSPLVRRVYQVLKSSFARKVILLDRYARNLVLSELASEPPPRYLTAPMYLLLSQEEGGFSRHGFWLQDAAGRRQLVLAGYVDLVVRLESVEDGDFEEIFSHELGHQILRELVGQLPLGPSRNMHLSMTITDNPTAFDEGYAEHFQPLVRDATANSYRRKLTRGAASTDLSLLFISPLDEQLRTDGVKRNLFIHCKALPGAALDPGADRYRLFLDDQTSTAFLNGKLRNGQQMMGSEGVIATLFYRIVDNPMLRNRYRAPWFYRPFLGHEVNVDELREAISPYQNVNLKLFAAMRRADKPIAAGAPPMVALVNSYAAAFPDEARNIYTVFLETTRGATASQKLAEAFERAAADGRSGDISAFRRSSIVASSLLRAAIDHVSSGELSLDSNLGPQLWLLNRDFKIASEVWSSDRTLPFTLNLNTASEVDLMTIPGVDLTAARKIVAARRARGFFRGTADLDAVVPLQLSDRLRSMKKQMKSAPSIPRP
jgi:Helix-hairpin-helix motif